jgi:glycosyltransferase involved in cell wall biosynthesis
LAVWWAYSNRSYDLIYAHFLQSVIPVFTFLRKLKAPVLLNLGESDPWDYNLYYKNQGWLKYLQLVTYIVTVSKVNFDYVLSLDSDLASKTNYIPNGVNTRFFKPLDKIECRKKLDMDLDASYVVFCGHLDERKGPLRVLAAIQGTSIKGLFLGSNGPDAPEGEEVAYLGPVENNQMPIYLNACDVFVLPSRSEGMSNAVLEAMACCIPMVISDLPFNTDFIPANAAIFINPNDISEIRSGIFRAISPDKNKALRNALIAQRENISIETRIKRIIQLVNR